MFKNFLSSKNQQKQQKINSYSYFNFLVIIFGKIKIFSDKGLKNTHSLKISEKTIQFYRYYQIFSSNSLKKRIEIYVIFELVL